MCVWWTCLCGTQIGFIQEWVKRLDRTFHAHQFIFSFFSYIFLFYSCGGLSWLSVNFLLHVKYALSYRIISYRIVSYRKRWHKPILHNARTLATVGTREERCRSKIILDRGRKVCPKRLQQTQTITATFSAIIFVYYGVLCYLHCCCTRWDR